MAEYLEKPYKHLAPLYNKSFVILGGNSFSSLVFVCSKSVLVSSVALNAGVRAPLAVGLLKLHSSIQNMRMLGNKIIDFQNIQYRILIFSIIIILEQVISLFLYTWGGGGDKVILIF